MEGDTLFQPVKARPTTGVGVSRWSVPLPADLLRAAVRRLRVLALLYAFVFFMAGIFPALLNPEYRAHFLGAFSRWGPGTISITIALLVAGVTLSRRIPASTILTVGLLFEVVGSFGIASAEYLGVTGGILYDGDLFGGFGLSWVSVWVLVFTIVVPSAPPKALTAAIASVSAVPITMGLAMRFDVVPLELNSLEFFFSLMFPYMLVVLMAYIGARVVYQLGTDVSRAREMGSYQLVELLGRGGMGEVWRAKHRMLARPAAIKLVRQEVLGAGDGETAGIVLTRFEREAQATASMRSPHTVDLYDFGVSDDGTFYYVSELLDGSDLDTLVEQFGPVPAERAIHFLSQICHSLAEAHENDLIHRDIKPANIYACRYGREVDFVKVLDFGLVKSQRERERDDIKLTAENVASGTPAFMAPEQVMGDQEIDGRADIYSLGCVGYWLVTGRLVFKGDTPISTMLQHVQTAPTPPSQLSELEIPASLDDVLLACLEKDPNRRPQGADALLQLLTSVVSDVPAWTDERAHHWWDAHQPRSAVRSS